jgi:protein-S-isoprenylcysteine O-methyltransferase Ste14
LLTTEDGMPFALKKSGILAYYAFLLCIVFPCDIYLRRKTRISLLGTFDAMRISKNRRWIFLLGILGSLLVLFYPLAFLFYPRLTEFTRLFKGNLVEILGLALIASGMLVDLIAISRLVVSRSLFPEPDAELLTTGVYRLARNPVYLGAYVSLLGIFCLLPTGIYLVGLTLYTLGNHVRVLREEEYLRTRFGHAYEMYCRSVGRYSPRIRG